MFASAQYNIEIIERFHALRMIVDSPWCVPNTAILRDLQIPAVEEEIPATALNIVLASAHIQIT
jgi:hypothetical protein